MMIYAVMVCGVLALTFAWVRSAWIQRQDPGNEKMVSIAGHIREGAMAFLTREYRILAVFVAVAAALLAWANWGKPESSALIGVSLIAGALCSGLA
ncbi:MAG: sodium/proton-translocating pyrophosphatase, partial [Thermoanaerobaculia bacterium]